MDKASEPMQPFCPQPCSVQSGRARGYRDVLKSRFAFGQSQLEFDRGFLRSHRYQAFYLQLMVGLYSLS